MLTLTGVGDRHSLGVVSAATGPIDMTDGTDAGLGRTSRSRCWAREIPSKAAEPDPGAAAAVAKAVKQKRTAA
jgi:hypothetical protein